MVFIKRSSTVFEKKVLTGVAISIQDVLNTETVSESVIALDDEARVDLIAVRALRFAPIWRKDGDRAADDTHNHHDHCDLGDY